MTGITEKKIVDMLTINSVSILTQKFIDIEGVPTQVGSNHRTAYTNSALSREALQSEQPEDVVNAVLAMWGDTPTVVDTILTEDNEVSEIETTEEVISSDT